MKRFIVTGRFLEFVKVDIIAVLVPFKTIPLDPSTKVFHDVIQHVVDDFDLDICRIALVPWGQYPFSRPISDNEKKNFEHFSFHHMMTFGQCLVKSSKFPPDIRKLLMRFLWLSLQGNRDATNAWYLKVCERKHANGTGTLVTQPLINFYDIFIKGKRFNHNAACYPEKHIAILEWIPQRLFISQSTDHSLTPCDDVPFTAYPWTPVVGRTREIPDDVYTGYEKLSRVRKYEKRGFMIADFPSRVYFTKKTAKKVELIEEIISKKRERDDNENTYF